MQKLACAAQQCFDESGSQRIALPVIQSESLWQRTARWNAMGSELFKLQCRKRQSYCLAPTHEELVTFLVGAAQIKKKMLPLSLYQIGEKFRDEARPRGGLLRARAFTMLDCYTFDERVDDASKTYERVVGGPMARFFDMIRLPVAVARADSGAIGGTQSHEFHVVDERGNAGEDRIVQCDQCQFAANVECAHSLVPDSDSVRLIDTYAVRVVADGDTDESEPLALFALPAGRVLNMRTVSRLLGINTDEDTLRVELAPPPPPRQQRSPRSRLTRSRVRSPLPPIYVDEDNVPAHLWPLRARPHASLVHVASGDLCPECDGGVLAEHVGVEVGHAFLLGDIYSAQLDAAVDKQPLQMGCFGIGISRLMAAAVERCHDERGIRWPSPHIAPFKVAVVTVGAPDDVELSDAAERLYDMLDAHADLRGDVLLDDSRSGFGAKLSEAELIGYPFVAVLGAQYRRTGLVELRRRDNADAIDMVALDDLASFIVSLLKV
jgi:prolyl-tRNA synthetase